MESEVPTMPHHRGIQRIPKARYLTANQPSIQLHALIGNQEWGAKASATCPLRIATHPLPDNLLALDCKRLPSRGCKESRVEVHSAKKWMCPTSLQLHRCCYRLKRRNMAIGVLRGTRNLTCSVKEVLRWCGSLKLKMSRNVALVRKWQEWESLWSSSLKLEDRFKLIIQPRSR